MQHYLLWAPYADCSWIDTMVTGGQNLHHAHTTIHTYTAGTPHIAMLLKRSRVGKQQGNSLPPHQLVAPIN
jgi:predicted Co/Zn/Cd cation transporter (cation efflux family)